MYRPEPRIITPSTKDRDRHMVFHTSGPQKIFYPIETHGSQMDPTFFSVEEMLNGTKYVEVKKWISETDPKATVMMGRRECGKHDAFIF